ncbi:MAG TPA: hyaluronate lyase [Peptococcaceae bacterium]|nr:hyaluronate lyase [Peptococcaceae bacterium]
MHGEVVVNPVTRANNQGQIEIRLERGKVADCRSSCFFFRGFEIMLQGRDPRDAPYFTERICGICSAAHATAAAFAVEDLAGVRPPENGNILRNILLAADTVQNHVKHFYLFVVPDYAAGPDRPPFAPRYRNDYRLPPEVNARIIRHYFEAADISRVAHEILTVLGGKAPFTHGILAGGATVPPDGAVIMDLGARVQKLKEFVQNKMIPDAHTIAGAYPEYFELGNRPLRLLNFGFLPVDPERKRFHFPGKVVEETGMREVSVASITEELRHAYFREHGEPGQPGTRPTEAQPGKPGAYSWCKAPRYNGKAFEGGPLARLWITGHYRRGISAMDRIIARVLETDILCGLIEKWLDELQRDEPIFTPFEVPGDGEGLGLTGAMRGPLLHYMCVRGGRISRYDIITPSAWNFSPRDAKGEPGPVEEALVGTPIKDPEQPIEVGRIIRSFDPCYACATHLIAGNKRLHQFIV